jgi:hypothetical protein
VYGIEGLIGGRYSPMVAQTFKLPATEAAMPHDMICVPGGSFSNQIVERMQRSFDAAGGGL